jgi:hypothetical protein
VNVDDKKLDLEQQALWVARMVNGSQALEGEAVDPKGFERLVEVAKRALREKESNSELS